MKRQTIIAGSALLLCLVPMTGWAQEGNEEDPAGREEPAEVPAEGSEEGADETAPEGEVPVEGAEAPKSDGPKVGPGGREMRTDYPGTEEAMKERMDTDQIQGNPEEYDPDQPYDMQVRELETKIDDLKEKVFRSKSQVVLLRETLLGNRLAGSRAILTHVDTLGGRYSLKKAVYSLDGNRIFNEFDREGSLADKDKFEFYNGAIDPGTHNLNISLTYQGNSAVFNYFEGYQMKLEKSCKFSVEEGLSTNLDVTVYQDGGVTESVENRPNLRCEITKSELSASKPAAKKAGSGEAAAEGDAGEAQ